jgi:hypothetical protein
MRFTLVASAAALTALAGCGSSPGPSAEGAWFVSMASGSTGNCLNAVDIMAMAGSVTASSMGMVVVTGDNNTTITCTVAPAASGAANAFDVTANGTALGDPMVPASTLGLSVTDLAAGATMAKPATGTVQFLNTMTQNNEYASSSCDFYFSSSSEGVAAGQVWVTFACPTIVDGQQQSTCELLPSFAIFENCATM